MGKKYVIDLDESIYSLINNNLNPVSDGFEHVNGCKILVTDFSETSVSGEMNVDANIKYAEAMVARKLQDDGDFDEPVSIITHSKKKTGKNRTEIFFTAVPSRIYLQYLDKINGHEDLLIMLPVISVLIDFARQIPHKNPIAVVFRHGRFADLVVADKKRLYHITKCVAFDTTEEQILNLWKAIDQEIKTATEKKNICIEKIIYLNWIDTIQEEPFFDDFDTDCFVFNDEPVLTDDNICNVSFTRALKMCSPLKGIAPHNGKFFYYSGKVYPCITAMLIILIFAMSYGNFVYRSKAIALEQKISSIQGTINRMNHKAKTAIPVKYDYLKTVKFVDSIFYIKHLPSYRKIINDISSGLCASIKINDLKIDYTGRTMHASLTGVIDAGFNSAYKAHENFLSSLTADGYSIDKNIFNTEIQTSEFKLNFSWSLK